ncbi:MAG: ImmA/IrrE family metallo-endopeptidase [Chloroflexi bacterium]|nr:ImmA/IrrE family metallo-endopeptidase [Chloroflexota bacterium]
MISELSPEVVGSRLKFARRAAGLTLKQAGAALGLGLSTMSELESGKRKVSGIELYELAKLYHRSLGFFLENDETDTAFSVLLTAADNTISSETVRTFQELCRDYRNLARLMKLPDVPCPPDYSAYKPGWAYAEELAAAERGLLGLDSEPIKDIAALLEEKRGARVFHLPEQDAFSGALAVDGGVAPCFLINSNHPPQRRTFTIAHEYGHYVAHRDHLAHIDLLPAFESRKPAERFADAFAAAFLMPRKTVGTLLARLVTVERENALSRIVLRLAVYFGVSFEAMGWRLVSLRHMSSTRWDELRGQQIPSSPIARLLGYSAKQDEPPEVLPRSYKYLAYEAYRAKLISLEKLAELLRKNYYELREELGEDIAADDLVPA